ncbi:hypothetical protein [Mumia quercus]|uniref:hypothetical protein n=1 Tax=Mumia quercus TaxID=2976125 RepID=UPI0021CF4090|nr:hypothetical protein [Mumia quercus]
MHDRQRTRDGPRLTPSLTATDPLPPVIDPTIVKRVSLRATDLGGLTATVDGAVSPREVREGDVVEVDLSGSSRADLVVSLKQCNPLSAMVCATRTGALTVRTSPNLTLRGWTLFVSPNGDGFDDTATSRVELDPRLPVTARWRIRSTAGATVAGPYEFSAAEIAAGTTDEADIVIDLRKRLGRSLRTGEYRFEVETTGASPGFTKSTRKSVPLFVSSAPPITTLSPATSFFYPFAAVGSGSGVPTVMTFRPALDAYEARYGTLGYRILASNGLPLGGTTQHLDVRNSLAWDGYYRRDGRYTAAPAGTYRIELYRTRSCTPECERVYGPVSAPFTLRDRTPRLVHRSVTATARSTWKRTAAKRNARVKRGKQGALRFERKAPHGAGMVKTVHSVRLPDSRDRDSWVPFRVRLRGSWGNADDVRVAVISPQGKTVAHPILPAAAALSPSTSLSDGSGPTDT